jgi:Ca2+-binding EF-hand superfamily protein
MSITNIGISGQFDLGQRLQGLLSDIQAISPSNSAAGTSAAGSTAPFEMASPSPIATLTGGAQVRLGSEVLRVLIAMQQEQSATPSQAPSNTVTAPSAASTSSSQGGSAAGPDPLQQLFTAMDANGDGGISQSELENYIVKQGGTQGQADALYSVLNQPGANGITEQQLMADLQSGNSSGTAAPHAHHHHHMPSADRVAGDLIQAVDTNDDGSVSQSELEGFVTGLGGTKDEADSDYAALAGKGPGITSVQFAAAIHAFESSAQPQTLQTTGGDTTVLSFLDDISKAMPAPASQS